MTVRLPVDRYERWSDGAIEHLVGQEIVLTQDGGATQSKGTVRRAWREDDAVCVDVETTSTVEVWATDSTGGDR